MSASNEREKRQSIIDACRSMNALGINQGTSGNISLRHDERPADHADQRAVRDDAARADRVHGPGRLVRSRPAPVE